MNPGDLAELCYRHGWRDARRLRDWLAVLYAVSGGDPACVHLERRLVRACRRGDLVRVGGTAGIYGPVYAVASPESGILAAGAVRLAWAGLVVSRAYVGVAALALPVADLDTETHRRLLGPGTNLRDARLLQAQRGMRPWNEGPEARVAPVGPHERERARDELLVWLARDDGE